MDNARVRQIKTMLQQEPEDSFLNYALAMEYVGQHLDEEAIEILETLLSRDPDYTATYYHLAQAYVRKQQKEKALELMKQGMQVATRKKERHALSELQSAYNELLFEED